MLHKRFARVLTVLTILLLSWQVAAQPRAAKPQPRPAAVNETTPAKAGSTTKARPKATSPKTAARSSAAGQCSPVPSGLVAWWPGEGNASDRLGRSNGDTLQGMAYVPGKVGRAFRMDGERSIVQVPDTNQLNLTRSLSIEAWVLLNSVHKNRVGQILFRGDNRISLDPYYLAVSGAGQLLFHVESSTASAELTAPIAVKQWTHVAATLDDATGIMNLYVDGVLAARQLTQARPIGDLVSRMRAGVGIGNTQDAASFNQPFDGAIDELSIYNRALTANEVIAIYNAGSAGKCQPANYHIVSSPGRAVSPINVPPKGNAVPMASGQCVPTPAGLIGWWQGEGNARDRLGRNNGDTLQSTTYVPGRVGRAFNFDGNGQFVKVKASSNFEGGTGLTIEGWINPDGSSNYPLVDWNQINRGGVHLWVFDGRGRLFLNLMGIDGASHSLNSGSGIIKPRVFQHVAATYDAASGIARLYRNGVVMAEDDLGQFKPQTGLDLYFGHRPGSEHKFKGLMDEIAIYNRALTIAEVQSIYNAGSAGKCLAGQSAQLKDRQPQSTAATSVMPTASLAPSLQPRLLSPTPLPAPTGVPAIAIPTPAPRPTLASASVAPASVATAVPAPRFPPRPEWEKTIVNLPAPVEDAVAGANGQYLILWLKQLQQLAVFDTRQKQIVKYLPVPADDVKFAAGAKKLIVVLNDQAILQRWDLTSFERELTVPAPEGGPVHNMAMGYASNGPLLVVNELTAMYDPLTLQKLDVDMQLARFPSWASDARMPLQLRASGDGSVFGAWRPRGGDVMAMRLKGRTVDIQSANNSSWYLVPNFDGTMFYGQPLNADLKEAAPGRFAVAGPINEHNYVPVYGGGYFVAMIDAGNPEGGRNSARKITPVIYSETDAKLLLTLPALDEMAGAMAPAHGLSRFETRRSGLTYDKRLHVIPDAKLMVTIPASRDRLVLRRFDLTEELDKAGIDYLYVSSRPLRTVRKGQKFVYQVEVKSKRGGVRSSLDSGPPGMTLSATGKLEWTVPADYPTKEESVIMTIRDAAGQEIFHTFKIAVQPEASVAKSN